MRWSRNTSLMLPITNALRERVPVLTLNIRGLCPRLPGTNHASIKLPPLRPQLKRLQIPLPQSWDLLFQGRRTTMKLSLTRNMIRDYSSPASCRRLWKVMVTCKLRWPALCRFKRNKKGDVSSVSLKITS